MRKTINKIYPTVLALYFLFVFIFTLLISHPVAVITSTITSAVFLYAVCGNTALKKAVKVGMVLFLFSTLLTPLFVHKGLNIILYFPWGNPLTKEAIIYGFFTGLVIFSVILWSFSFAAIMTTDKLTFVFGKFSPSVSLILSVSLRLVPELIEKFKEVIALKTVNSGENRRNLGIGGLVSATSITMTWALDNCAQTAQSMKSRGYGSKKRSTFYRYNFCRRDLFLLIVMVFFGVLVAGLYITGKAKWNYFYGGFGFDRFSIILCLGLLIFYINPFLIKAGDIRWRR